MQSGPREGLLLHISPKHILPNRENPRLIFDEEDLALLRKSIHERGILVPLTVFRRKADGKYVLLDGERRWRCAIQLDLPEVPCNAIEEPSSVQNILFMFNIHNTRVDWELVPTALKLQTLLRMMPNAKTAELARLTGMSAIRVNDCKKVLTFPKRYLDLALLESGDKRRITGDFFSQLHRFLDEVERHPVLSKTFSRDKLTDLMIAKYRRGDLPGVLDFRTLKKGLGDARKGNVNPARVLRVTTNFLRSEMNPNEFYDNVTGSSLGLRKVFKAAERLTTSLDELEAEDVKEDENLVRSLRSLKKAIDRVLP
jgi:ParB/RepB/Spo0J family partition protein